jgi:DNA-binding transcriptional LysR family regulator
MELRHLRYFVAAAEEENVSRAALKLHVSQPGVSRQIRDLEEEIGFDLFQRGAQSLRLTEAGKKFLQHARDVLQRAEDAVKSARSVAEGAPGEIHVGYAPSLTIEILPRTLRAFQSKFRLVRVVLHDLTTEEILTRLHNGSLQAGLTVRPTARTLRGLSFRDLAHYPMRVAVAPKHPLAKNKTIRLEQLKSEQLIAYSQKEYPEYHKDLARIFAKTGSMPKIIAEHDAVSSLMAGIEAGCGFGLVPSCLAGMAGTRLKLIPLEERVPEIIVGAAWKGKTASALVSHFVAAAEAS